MQSYLPNIILYNTKNRELKLQYLKIKENTFRPKDTAACQLNKSTLRP